MTKFTNNFLNLYFHNLHKSQINYLTLSNRLAAFHAKCFKNSNHRLDKSSMFYFLKAQNTHLFYDQRSLAIIQATQLESDLISLAVDPSMRNHGIGSNLLTLVLEYLKHLNLKKIFLEVEANNITALNLYRKIGFMRCGLRKDYYCLDQGEKVDAIVMSYDLTRKSGCFDKKKLQKLYPTG